MLAAVLLWHDDGCCLSWVSWPRHIALSSGACNCDVGIEAWANVQVPCCLMFVSSVLRVLCAVIVLGHECVAG